MQVDKRPPCDAILEYQGEKDRRPSVRRVTIEDVEGPPEPGDTRETTRIWRVRGFCHEAKGAREFRSDRILQLMDPKTSRTFLTQKEIKAWLRENAPSLSRRDRAFAKAAEVEREENRKVQGWCLEKALFAAVVVGIFFWLRGGCA